MPPAPARRSDAGMVKLTGRDITGLVLCADHFGAPYDLAHIRAVLAVRLWLEAGQVYRDGRAWWRSERRIRAAIGGRAGTIHVPDAEVHWPSLDGSPYAGQVWAVEAELTPKPLTRTVAIMRGLLGRASDYGPTAAAGHGPRYGQVVYLTVPAARPVVLRAVDALAAPLQPRVVVRDLPPGAAL